MPRARDASGKFISKEKADEIVEATKREEQATIRKEKATQKEQQKTFDAANKFVNEYYDKVEKCEKIYD